MIHVMPQADERPHFFEKCWCHPTPDKENAMVMVHHSADGREEEETIGIYRPGKQWEVIDTRRTPTNSSN